MSVELLKSLMDGYYNLIYIVGITECTVRGVHVTGRWTAAAPAVAFLCSVTAGTFTVWTRVIQFQMRL